MDTDTVIQALESCIDERHGCYNCPIRYKNGNVACRLFTESYNSIPTELVRRALEMIKKQQQIPVKDVQWHEVTRKRMINGICPTCNSIITHFFGSRFCDKCGQAVKWE